MDRPGLRPALPGDGARLAPALAVAAHSLNRLFAGRLCDPMVGRDLLIGLALGAAVLLVLRAAG